MVLHRKHNAGILERLGNAPLINKVAGGKTTHGVRTWIYQDYASGGRWKADWAGRMTYEDREVYELQSDGSEFQPVSYDKLMIDPDGNPLLVLYSPEKGVYHPMTVDKEDYKFDVSEGNWVQWMSNAFRQQHEEWKMNEGAWWKDPQVIAFFSAGIFMFLTLAGFTYYIQNGMGEINAFAEAAKQAIQSTANAAR